MGKGIGSVNKGEKEKKVWKGKSKVFIIEDGGKIRGRVVKLESSFNS